jgi:hypothetical protein
MSKKDKMIYKSVKCLAAALMLLTWQSVRADVANPKYIASVELSSDNG